MPEGRYLYEEEARLAVRMGAHAAGALYRGAPTLRDGPVGGGHLIEQAEHGKVTPTQHAIGCAYVERESV